MEPPKDKYAEWVEKYRETYEVTSATWDKHTRAIYQLWYEWLGETNWEERTPEVQADFGDVTIPFKEWLPDHEWLWDETGLACPWHGEVLRTDALLKSYGDAGVQEDQLVIALNLHSSHDELKTFVQEVLTHFSPRKRGRPPLIKLAQGNGGDDNSPVVVYRFEDTKEYSRATRTIYYEESSRTGENYPNVLKLLLELHKANKARLKNNEGLTQRDEGYKPKWKLGDESNWCQQHLNDHSAMERCIDQELRKIDALLKNVARGIFPKYE